MNKLILALFLTLALASCLAHRRGGGRGGRGDSRARVTQAQVNRLKERIRPLIQGRRIPHMLRATFHDSVGGSDGCLNRNIDENSGPDNDEDNFTRIIDVMDDIYDNEADCTGLSRADFYVLAGEVAVENGVVNAGIADGICTGFDDCQEQVGKLNFNFQYGRKDCRSSPTTEVIRPFPDGHLNSTGVFDFFRSQYGMSVQESVAILGGHTVGRATGFLVWEGIWVEEDADELPLAEEIQFDNFFYQNPFDDEVSFSQVQLPDRNGERRFQWDGVEFEDGEREVYLMLNADMALLKEIQTDDEGRSACPDFTSCPDSDGAPFFRQFSQDNDLFLQVFSEAWRKMVTANTRGRLRNPSRK